MVKPEDVPDFMEDNRANISEVFRAISAIICSTRSRGYVGASPGVECPLHLRLYGRIQIWMRGGVGESRVKCSGKPITDYYWTRRVHQWSLGLVTISANMPALEQKTVPWLPESIKENPELPGG